MSATTASSFLSSRPTPHSKYYSSSSSSSDGPVSTDRDHTGSSSPHFHKTFQPHVLFRWTKPGKAVSVVGSWNGWGKPLALERTADAFCRGHLFSRMVALPAGRYHFKFIVDGAWQYDPRSAFEADEFGNINNVVDVQGGRESKVEDGLEEKEEAKEEEVKEESSSDGSIEGEEGHGHTLQYRRQQKQNQKLLRQSSQPMVVDPRHAAKPNSSWLTMSGEQAQSKWLHAGKAMERLNVKRSDSVEGVIAGLSMHERQQVNQSLKEYGLHTPTHSGDNNSSGSRMSKSASLTVFSSSPTAMGLAPHPTTSATLAPPLEEINILTPTSAADFVVLEAHTNTKPFSNSNNINSSTSTTTRIRPEEKEQHLAKQQVSSSSSSPSSSSSFSTSNAPHSSVSSSNSLLPSLASRRPTDDNSHPPATLQKSVSRRGSCLVASFLGNSCGPGQGFRMTKSRSLTDLETMGGEYSNAPSMTFALHGGGMKVGGVGKVVRTLQKKQAACCAAVGSCQVKSSVRREGKMILAMVGLPGRGKTHIAKAIRRHLEWMGMKVGYFSSSEYRWRSTAGKNVSPDFFDPTDGEAWQYRKEIAACVLQDILAELDSTIDIAVLDAANCTRSRRGWIQEQVRASGLYATVIFIESICTVPEIVASNIHQTILRSPEYSDLSEAEAMANFERKNQHYLSIYETLDEDEGVPFLKLVDAGQKIVSFRINGYVPGRLLLLLANIHTKPRPIWFSRHGESMFNSQGRIGGDSPLSARGILYAQKLEEFVHSIYQPGDPSDRANPNLTVWTSTMVRTGMTVAGLNQSWEVIKWRCLDEIDAGMCDGLTYNEVAAQFPEEYRKRKEDKYNYRYPRGESYQDLFLRLEPLLFEMLRSTGPLLVVGHQAILRILYGYLTGKRPEQCPDLPVPLHTVIQLTPQAFGCEEVWHTPMPGGEELVGSANGHN